MKISITAFGNSNNTLALSKWIKYYEINASSIPAVLIYKDVNQEILDMWPYEKIEYKPDLDISSSDAVSSVFSKSNICEIMKLTSYSIVGDTLAMDYDCIIKRKLTADMIPSCNWGMCRYTRFSNYFVDRNIMQTDLYHFDELDIVSWCNCGVQVVRQDYSQLFWKMFKQYISKYEIIQYIQNYSADILCLVHKLSGGVYLAPEWNWYPLSSIANNNIIIEHYYGEKAKLLMGEL